MLVGISPEPCVAQTTSSTSCALRSAADAAASLTSTTWPAVCRTGFSASATIWALPDSVPTRIRIEDIASDIRDRVSPCDATSPRAAAVGERWDACQSRRPCPLLAMTEASPDEQPLIATLADGVLTLTLNRPQRLNAMNQELIGRLA